MGKIRSSTQQDPVIQGLTLDKGTYIDDLGRSRDSSMKPLFTDIANAQISQKIMRLDPDAIVMPGRKRAPQAPDMTYVERLERHNIQLEVENNELRSANQQLRGKKAATTARAVSLHEESLLMLEEIDRLRTKVTVSSDTSRHNEVSNIFLKHDIDHLNTAIKQISNQNSALAAGLIGTPLDPNSGKLVSPHSLSDEGSQMYQNHTQSVMSSTMLPQLPNVPLERAKYPTKARVECLLSRVGVVPTTPMMWEQCATLQGALDDVTGAEQQAKLEARCQSMCKNGGMEWESAMHHFCQNSSQSLARAEKVLGLTTVYYNPFVYDPIGS